MAKKKPSLLQFSSRSKPREYILFDGEPYELLSIEEISFGTTLKAGQIQTVVANFTAPDNPISQEKLDQLEEFLAELCDEIVQAPKEVKAKLNDLQRLQIISSVFTAPVPLEVPAKKKTSRSSRGSKDSTEAIPAAG